MIKDLVSQAGHPFAACHHGVHKAYTCERCMAGAGVKPCFGLATVPGGTIATVPIESERALHRAVMALRD